MAKIGVIGTGYVGLVTGACFAHLGHQVTCVDVDEAKIEALRHGRLPIHEPGLEDIVHEGLDDGRLEMTTSFQEGVADAEFVFICVGTPSGADHHVDMGQFRQVYQEVVRTALASKPVIVHKSTVPPGTADSMAEFLGRLANGRGAPPVVANPEFLREGKAVYDFTHPARVVVGSFDTAAAAAVAALYEPLACPTIVTSARTAEMIKYASNAFLAAKISFVNEIGSLCEAAGVDVEDVANGIGLDPRIGRDFLNAGIGYGGSCLPKDVGVLRQTADDMNVPAPLLQAVIEVNEGQPERLVRKVGEALGALSGARVAVLGLAFKPETDDIRHSPAMQMVQRLLDEGAEVRGCDPEAWRNALRALDGQVECSSDPYETARGCDAVILATEWPQFRGLDLVRMRRLMAGSVLADGRNAVDPGQAAEAGFRYLALGRPSSFSAVSSAVPGRGFTAVHSA